MESRLLVWLLIMAFVLTSTSSAITLSSKLIHRFSQEMKGFRVSSSWPEWKSREYYELLLNTDFQRQKMKLGTHYNFLFPSQGSKTMSFGNDFGWLHYSWIDIGTPNVPFLVALDSGSDFLWLPCDCIDCAPLSASYYGSLDRDLGQYSPSRSSTSKHLTCSHELCELGPNCKSPKQPCPYIAKYYSENTSSSGFLVEDTLHLTASNGHASKSLVNASVVIGCGRKQSGGYLDGVAPDGLLGLGLGSVSVPSVLAKTGLMRNSFSICFNEDDSGRIFFGDEGAAAQQSAPFMRVNSMAYMVEVEGFCIGANCLERSGFQAQVDSGTSFTFLPDEVYKKVSVEFDRIVTATKTRYGDSPWEYCYEASSLLKVPNMTLMFASNNSFVVHNPFFFVYDGDQITGFCLAIQSTEGDFGIIGQNFMTGYRIVFDRENLKLHWSHSDCQDLSNGETKPSHDRPEDPLPTNEQQTPHGQAVAPAVAGRTPPHRSAVSPSLTSQFIMLELLLLLLLPFLSV